MGLYTFALSEDDRTWGIASLNADYFEEVACIVDGAVCDVIVLQ